MILKTQATRAEMDKEDHLKSRSFCTEKGTIGGVKRQPMEWEKAFANQISDMGLISKI